MFGTRRGPDARKKTTSLGTVHPAMESLCAQNRLRALCSFTGGHQKAYNGASARSWILVFCKKGNSGICSEDDFFIVFFLLTLARSHWQALSHITTPCGMAREVFLPSRKRTARSQHLLTTQEMHSQLESSSWAGITGRQQ
ncbi:hypothetical protein CGRA01v4_06993 [Colletotrichum graminicola]|uniref:Uncharacterized protein n=1 Tax=Colletotrichum graminicola (strain M1.001 / M2 / FGSC 10212) TaxID=645133 RepID=E3QR10_COLGM|nr:uncharacterized protein GLRG_08442 [Colletotrichum graminicola M1.001]EFQ33298.1 hypothetical protein GLRG_08442 [Colletotrichum graminicola M1.001]WDK15712.1 hypothetical protein CGRA01v4_06993 [Colletotrichum graminicola]